MGIDAYSNFGFTKVYQDKTAINAIDFLKTKVQLQSNSKGKGKLMIPFTSEKELERIIELLGL